MTEIISVKFKNRGKTYFFDPGGVTASAGQRLVVQTSKGLELVDCVHGNHYVDDSRIIPPLRPVVRVATEDDLRVESECRRREKEAFPICAGRIAAHGLEMKLVDVECNFEGTKMIFFFTSEGRVDFRELVKDLAGIFRTRIELRQIGVRDEAKMLGGIGICGRPYCCSQFLDEFRTVSTKMAKTQSLSMNPGKISGCCGRLMCCLRYEQEAYDELIKTVPKTGAFVETTAGYGNVTQVNLLRGKVKVKLDTPTGEPVFKMFDSEDVAAVPGGRPQPGQPLPHVLQPHEKKPKEEEPPEEEDAWAMPQLLVESEPSFSAPSPAAPAAPAEPQRPRTNANKRRRKKSGGDRPHAAAPDAPQRPKQPKPQYGDKPKSRPQGERPSKPRSAQPQPNGERAPGSKPERRRQPRRRPPRQNGDGEKKTEQ
ncbi:MAG: hypothetical protein LIO57_06655 [Oscillospiraceae bacterium]|nr:hypothetical protein [Oscillospiraceae bacterium]